MSAIVIPHMKGKNSIQGQQSHTKIFDSGGNRNVFPSASGAIVCLHCSYRNKGDSKSCKTCGEDLSGSPTEYTVVLDQTDDRKVAATQSMDVSSSNKPRMVSAVGSKSTRCNTQHDAIRDTKIYTGGTEVDDDASFNDDDVKYLWDYVSSDDESTEGVADQASHEELMAQELHARIAAQEHAENLTRQKEEEAKRLRQEAESAAMLSSVTGRAYRLVEEVVKLRDELLKRDKMKDLSLDVVASDDIVELAEQFINHQIGFQSTSRSTTVTCGYHYTNQRNLQSIREDGLMSYPDLASRNIAVARRHGTAFGDGIYTGRNPEAFQLYGDTGLIVAILKGNEGCANGPRMDPEIDTAVGNKKRPKDPWRHPSSYKDPDDMFDDEVVLRRSSQCLPLFKFQKHGSWTYNFGDDADWDNLWACHEELQKVLDRFFNNGEPEPIHRFKKPGSPSVGSGVPVSTAGIQQPLWAASATSNFSQINPSFFSSPAQSNAATVHFGGNSPLFGSSCQPLGGQPANHSQPFSAFSTTTAGPFGRPPANQPVFGGQTTSHAFLGSGMSAAQTQASQSSVQPFRSQPAVQPFRSQPAVQPFGGQSAVQPFGSQTGVRPVGSQSGVQTFGGQSWPGINPLGIQPAHKPTFGAQPTTAPFGPTPLSHGASSRHGGQTKGGLFRPSQTPFGQPSGGLLTAQNASAPLAPATTPFSFGHLNNSPFGPSQCIPTETLTYTAPEKLARAGESCVKVVNRPKAKGNVCPICLDDCSRGPDEPVTLPCKNHMFHRCCIKKALQSSKRCPVCRQLVGEPQGKSPSGKMEIKRTHKKCGGFESCTHGSIMITYTLGRGVQKSYHPNPGCSYRGTTRIAYLPDNDDGRQLLKRLKYAWKHGVSFTVGTSLTSGQTNCITWSSIHHKTSLRGGTLSHGFPDFGYFINCNEELDNAGVPSAIDLP